MKIIGPVKVLFFVEKDEDQFYVDNVVVGDRTNRDVDCEACKEETLKHRESKSSLKKLLGFLLPADEDVENVLCTSCCVEETLGCIGPDELLDHAEVRLDREGVVEAMVQTKIYGGSAWFSGDDGWDETEIVSFRWLEGEGEKT